jgi:hypothetical protein
VGGSIGRQVNLAKDFAAAGNKPVRCHTCKALAALDASDREALQAAIDNRNLSVSMIVAVCAKNGISVNKSSVYEHRQGRCPKP